MLPLRSFSPVVSSSRWISVMKSSDTVICPPSATLEMREERLTIGPK
jgi:hypothetical protein